MNKKKNIFTKAIDSLVNILAPNVTEEVPQHVKESRKREHEKTLKQPGMGEFLETINNAKTIKISIEKNYDSVSPLSDVYNPYLTYKIGKYTISRGNVYVNDKKILKLDKEICTIIEKKAMELNPNEVKKAKKEIEETSGKRAFAFSKER